MRLIIAIVCALALSGCAGLSAVTDTFKGISEYFGGEDAAEPPAELQPIEASVKASLLWDAGIGKGYAKQFVNLVPAVTADRVFAADRKGQVQARNRLNGDKIWSVDTELDLSAGPVAGLNQVFLGTSNGEVLALNVGDGSLAWKKTLSSEVLALPQVSGSRLVVRSSDGRIVAIDTKTGASLWYYDRAVPPLSLRGRGSPTIAGDLVVDGYASGKLMALRLSDGKPQWEATVALPHGRSEIERLVDVDGVPIVRDDTIYVTGYQGGVAAVALNDGDVLWRQENIFSHLGMAANRRSLFITDIASNVWELDMRNGADLWKQEALHHRRLTAPAAVGGYVVVGDFEGYLHCLSQDDGSQVARIRIDGGPIEATPVVFDGITYVYTSRGTLAAVSLE